MYTSPLHPPNFHRWRGVFPGGCGANSTGIGRTSVQYMYIELTSSQLHNQALSFVTRQVCTVHSRVRVHLRDDECGVELGGRTVTRSGTRDAPHVAMAPTT